MEEQRQIIASQAVDELADNSGDMFWKLHAVRLHPIAPGPVAIDLQLLTKLRRAVPTCRTTDLRCYVERQ